MRIKSFNVWFSKYHKQSPGGVLKKKYVLKINILQTSLKNIYDTVFNLLKFQAEILQLY